MSAEVTTTHALSGGGGSLDLSFANNGIGQIGTYEWGNDVAIQADGRAIVAGWAVGQFPGYYSSAFMVRRLTSQGTPDLTFGNGGRVLTNVGYNGMADAIAIQPDGKFVVVGSRGGNWDNHPIVIVRYNADGSLDSSFGTGGSMSFLPGGLPGMASDVVIQPDGKIVIVGSANNSGSNFVMMTARLTSSGSLDGTFGSGGVVRAPVSSYNQDANAVEIADDGKVLVAGYTQRLDTSVYACCATAMQIAVLRYDTNGVLDTSFGTAGKATIELPKTYGASDIELTQDGSVLVSTDYFVGSSRESGLAVIKLAPDGLLDSGFGTSGITKVPIPTNALSTPLVEIALSTSIVEQSDGSILIGGGASNSSGYMDKLVLSRVTPAGNLDSTFGNGGLVITNPGRQSSNLLALALQPDGLIVAAGGTDSNNRVSGNQQVLVARYTSSGYSSNSSLSGLSLSTGALSPSFSSGTTSYAVSVPYATTSLSVTPTVGDALASVKVNGSTVSSGVASQSISLSVGSNEISVVVTAQDGTTTTYAVTATRLPKSANSSLSGLSLSTSVLSPSFSSGTTSYTVSVPYATASLRVTPTVGDALATVKVNGSTVSSSSASGPVSLSVGPNTITVVVTAEDGTTTTYAITTTRQPASSNSSLSGLSLSTGALSPSFSSGTTSYTVSVPYATTSLSVTPTVGDALATVKVNGSTVSYGSASGPVSLSVGSNTITVVVTAQDGTTTTYAITTTRRMSNDSLLAGLSLSTSVLSPSFSSGTTSYTVSVPYATTSLSVTPTVGDALATVKVNGSTVSYGSASGPVSLSVGSNTITVVVTAQDGTTTTYAITTTRADNLSATVVASRDVYLAGAGVRLDAGFSNAASGIVKYEWDLNGDGVFERDSGANALITATWITRGFKTILLRITANSGATSTTSLTLEIRSAPPEGDAGISINAGVPFTKSRRVAINVVWPAYATAMKISNDGGFAASTTRTFDLVETMSWDLDDSIQGAFSKIVYVRFLGSTLDSTKTYQDDIILDTNAPGISSIAARYAATATTINLRAVDDITGLDRVEVMWGQNFASYPYNESIDVPLSSVSTSSLSSVLKFAVSTSLQIRISDKAGNWTSWFTVAVQNLTTSSISSTRPITVKRGKLISAGSFAKLAGLKPPRLSKISIRVKSGRCSANKAGLIASRGECKILISVTKNGKQLSRKTVTVSPK
jgi:uncharacterized delta-60 repeat protein